jgi:hypothetical protein
VRDAGGNRERIGFLYDARLMEFTGLASHLHPPRNKDGDEYLARVSWTEARPQVPQHAAHVGQILAQLDDALRPDVGILPCDQRGQPPCLGGSCAGVSRGREPCAPRVVIRGDEPNIVHGVGCSGRWIDPEVSSLQHHIGFQRPTVVPGEAGGARGRECSGRSCRLPVWKTSRIQLTKLRVRSGSDGVPGLCWVVDTVCVVYVWIWTGSPLSGLQVAGGNNDQAGVSVL